MEKANISYITEEIVASLKKIVGADAVKFDVEGVSEVSDAILPNPERSTVAVYPKSKEEVVELVNFAKSKSLHLYTVATGKNWGYGSSTSNQTGNIVVVLERMNKIHHVDEELAYAVIEPGVTQQQFYEYLQEHCPSLWADVTDSTPNGSIIGNALERGVGYTPYGDHFGCLCGMEVVLSDGSVLHTDGGPDQSKTFHTFRWGAGPVIDGLFSQSNYGIVTKAGIWLMPAPDSFTFVICELKNTEDIAPFMCEVRDLQLRGVLSNIHCLNDFLVSTSRMQYPYDLRGDQKMLSDEQLQQIFSEQELAPWNMICGLYGSELEVWIKRRKVSKALSKYGKLQFLGKRSQKVLRFLVDKVETTDPGSVQHMVMSKVLKFLSKGHKVGAMKGALNAMQFQQGIPGEYIVKSVYFKRRAGRPIDRLTPVEDKCGLLWLAIATPIKERELNNLVNLAKQEFKQFEFEFTAAIISLSARTVVLAMPMFYDVTDSSEVERVQKLYESLISKSRKEGYLEYRTSTQGMQSVLNDADVFKEVCSKIKNSLDPNNIFSPKKYSVDETPKG